MTTFRARIGSRAASLPQRLLCDAWLAEDERFGDQLLGLDSGVVLGRWPDELETDATLRLAEAVGDAPTWEAHAEAPPVAQRLAERARPQPLDLEIFRYLQHLQHVCHHPRLHLRVEEERLPVSRARRTPVRAVADLVSHPGDWEHRTLRSIQPSRVLARQIEDEWNLYENRVAARLVDNLLGYVAKRLEELRKIMAILDASRDYGEEIRRTSFRRAHRISELWSNTLESKTEADLRATMQRLGRAQRHLQALLDAPLYLRVPQRQTVALSLRPTNILINDPYYRKVALLWRSWVLYGHKHQETHRQRAARRQREAGAWDRFVLHLVVRAFAALGWRARAEAEGTWSLDKDGWLPIRVAVDPQGVVSVEGSTVLRLLPLCASFVGADTTSLAAELEGMDAPGGETVVIHVGVPVALEDVDRAAGWSFRQRTVLFACSPWGIDSEERMARLIHGWLSRAAVLTYPLRISMRGLPALPSGWDWLRYQSPYLVALRAPDPSEARAWAVAQARELDARAQQASLARQAFDLAPREALNTFQKFIAETGESLAGLDLCPVCGERGFVEPRTGRQADGSDATWWARCGSCSSEWGLRPCTGCRGRYRALEAQTGINLATIAPSIQATDWPDKVLGRDVWAQPCCTGTPGQFRCPHCGVCSGNGCPRCLS